MGFRRACSLVAPLLLALDHAHQHGVVHADVTPRNIVLPSPMWPMLTAFAIGRNLPDQSQTSRRLILGTPAYLAPEQAFGLPVDSRTDVYSLAVVLYEALVGRVPFLDEDPQTTLRRQAYETPPPLRRFRAEIPVALERAVLRALAKDPDSRYETAREFAEALETALADQGATAEAAHPQPSLPPADPLAADYAEGVQAFSDRRWDSAVAALARVADVDPGYEDVEALLAAARSALAATGDT
jgi:serine/threonine-protein kinase